MLKRIDDRLADWLADVAGALLLGTGIFCFAEKMNIAPGGVSGVAIMIKHLIGLPVGLVSLVINIPLLIAAYKYIGKRFAVRTVRTVIINALLLDGVVMQFFPQYAGDRMVGSIFGGVCMGAGIGIIFLRGSSTGGTDVVSYYGNRLSCACRICCGVCQYRICTVWRGGAVLPDTGYRPYSVWLTERTENTCYIRDEPSYS